MSNFGPKNHLATTSLPPQPTVELRAAPLPAPLQLFAVHLYFITTEGNEPWQRWEVWQRRNAFRHSPQPHQKAYGHVHVNLMAPDQGVGGGPSYPLQRWIGEDAERIVQALKTCTASYIGRDRYLLWPGPNSNTYVARILTDAGIDASLPATAIGKDWDGTFKVGMSLTPLKLNLYTPLFGATLALAESFEMQLLGLGVGIHWKRREMKLPVGKGLWKF